MVEEAEFRWHESLGVAPKRGPGHTPPRHDGLAMLYHPDTGGQPEQMTRVNAADEWALRERPR